MLRPEPVARRPQRLLYAMEGHVGADAGVSEMQRAGIGAVMHARVARREMVSSGDAGTGISEMDGDEKMVSRWRYKCPYYGTARNASAPAAHTTQSVSTSLPVDAVYFPAAHGCLSEPTGQKKPAGQI